MVWPTATPPPGTEHLCPLWASGRGRAVRPNLGSWAVARGDGAPKLHTVPRDAKHLGRRDELKGHSRQGPLQHCGSKALLGDGEMEVQIPSGRKGIEHGSPTSWVTALITALGDKKGMTAAVVNLTSYIFEDFFLSVANAPKKTFLMKRSTFLAAKYMEFVLFQQRKPENSISDWSDCGVFSPFCYVLLLKSIINYLHKPIIEC